MRRQTRRYQVTSLPPLCDLEWGQSPTNGHSPLLYSHIPERTGPGPTTRPQRSAPIYSASSPRARLAVEIAPEWAGSHQSVRTSAHHTKWRYERSRTKDTMHIISGTRIWRLMRWRPKPLGYPSSYPTCVFEGGGETFSRRLVISRSRAMIAVPF